MSRTDNPEKPPKRFRKIRLTWRLLKWGLRLFVVYRSYQERRRGRKSRSR
jgi:hypothetical protein